jgi:hypothetical protein
MIPCLVSIPFKLIFIWSPKAASTTIKNIFYDYVGVRLPNKGWIINTNKWQQKHNLQKWKLPANNESYLKVQFVRNPYERAVSSFLHHVEYRDKHKCQQYQNFNDFLVNVKNKQIKCEGCGFHSTPQYHTKKINEIIKIENLEKEIIRLNSQYNLNLKNITYQKHSYRKTKDYNEYLQPKAINLINEIYKKDIQYFGYEFQQPFKLI